MFILQTRLDRHSLWLIIDDSLLADPPLFSLPSTFKAVDYTEVLFIDTVKRPKFGNGP
jgi:hypothetical protein